MASLLTSLDSKCSCEHQTYLSNNFLAIPSLDFSEASQTHMSQTGNPDVPNATFSPCHFPILVNGKCAFLAVCTPTHDVTHDSSLTLHIQSTDIIPVATLFKLSQVWQPSVPPAQARPPLHLTWTTGSISYMIAPNPHLALPQLTLCSTTRQIPFKCHDISLLLCLNTSQHAQNKTQSPPHAHTRAVMWALYLPPSPPHSPLPMHSNHTGLPTAPQIHQAQSKPW